MAINSAPTEGVKRRAAVADQGDVPGAQEPGQPPPAVGFTLEQWHYAFTNTFSEEESRALYERYHIPASGAIFWGSALANIHPGHQDTCVDYNNDDRAPLLFISGSEDHLMPPKIQQSNAKHYKSDTITEVKEFEGRRTCCPPQEGWEEVADYALDWALEHATTQRRADVSGVRITHIGGPTVLIEVGGWRLLTDPTFDAPGRSVRVRLGHGVAQARRAGDRRRRPRRRSTPCCSATTTTATTSTTPAARCSRRRASSSPPCRGARAARRRRARARAVGRRRGSRRPGGRRSRSPPRRAATARRSATRSSAT